MWTLTSLLGTNSGRKEDKTWKLRTNSGQNLALGQMLDKMWSKIGHYLDKLWTNSGLGQRLDKSRTKSGGPTFKWSTIAYRSPCKRIKTRKLRERIFLGSPTIQQSGNTAHPCCRSCPCRSSRPCPWGRPWCGTWTASPWPTTRCRRCRTWRGFLILYYSARRKFHPVTFTQSSHHSLKCCQVIAFCAWR